MNPLSHDVHARACKIEAVILQGLASVGQAPVAQALRVSESTVSRMKDGEITRLALVLAICELKVVRLSSRCYKPEIFNALSTLAHDRLASMQIEAEGVKELQWGDD